ncbi:MAG: hypothetical protein HC905_19905 [Bacteroidales bacterium]|nr:hypothetical protein [Bacteroidales bacterium]
MIILLFTNFSGGSFQYRYNNPEIKRSSEYGKSKKPNRKAEIDINYCLLNKKGEPSNQFTEGENFTFSLSIRNNSGDTLFMDNSFLSEISGFCTVYNEENQQVGQPYLFTGATIVPSEAHPFYGKENVYELRVPWNDSRSLWSTLHFSFKGSNQKSLPKGKYYTFF